MMYIEQAIVNTRFKNVKFKTLPQDVDCNLAPNLTMATTTSFSKVLIYFCKLFKKIYTFHCSFQGCFVFKASSTASKTARSPRKKTKTTGTNDGNDNGGILFAKSDKGSGEIRLETYLKTWKSIQKKSEVSVYK